jgi:polynucleotide 5'-kinase involved in rRNA processing
LNIDTGRFDLSKYGSSAYKSSMLLYELILEKIGKVETLQDGLKPSISSEWSERESDQQKLSSNLNHAPESYSLILGPKGSGKSKFINDILKTKQLFIPNSDINWSFNVMN